MQMRFFSIPVAHGDDAAEALNRFLRGHRILSVDRELVQDGRNSVWTICVSYIEEEGRPPAVKRGKIDYREVLSEPDFAVYAKLRTLRQALAGNLSFGQISEPREARRILAHGEASAEPWVIGLAKARSPRKGRRNHPSAKGSGPHVFRRPLRGLRSHFVLVPTVRNAHPPAGGLDSATPFGRWQRCDLKRLSPGVGRKGADRAVRGGNWNDNAQNARSAYRNWNGPGNRNDSLGFRCARAHERTGRSTPEQTGVPSIRASDGKQQRPPVC